MSYLLEDALIARILCRIPGLKAAYLDDSRHVKRIYLVTRLNDYAFLDAIRVAKERILDRYPCLPFAVYVRLAPIAVGQVTGRRLKLR